MLDAPSPTDDETDPKRLLAPLDFGKSDDPLTLPKQLFWRLAQLKRFTKNFRVNDWIADLRHRNPYRQQLTKLCPTSHRRQSERADSWTESGALSGRSRV